LKIWTPDPDEADERPPQPEPPATQKSPLGYVRKKHPRCRCGCGRAAYWPQDGKPVFHTRLCGYLMAVKIVRRRKAR
jgi:hypothetical protein